MAHGIGRVAIVTGAGSGIGRAVALALSAKGYRVALAGRRIEKLHETAALLGEAPSLCVQTDICDETDVDHLFAKTSEQFRRVDLVFNNAGLGAFSTPIENVALNDFKAVLDVNVTGTFLCMRAAFRVMKGQAPAGGRIINNGSLSAHVPRPLSVAYATSKHAVTGLTRAGAIEGRAHGIACCQIDIGNAASELAASFEQGMLQPDGSVRPEPLIDAAYVGEAVCHMDSLPLEANIPFLTLMATNMPFMGRG